MNKRLKYNSLLLACLSIAKVASAGEATFGYAPIDQATPNVTYGTLIAETYDIAIRLNSPYLVGKQISAIAVPVQPSTFYENAEGQRVQTVDSLSFWLSSELKLEKVDGKNVNVPDIMVKCVEMPNVDDAGYVNVMATCILDEPITIPEGGLYAGYSIRVAKTDDYNNTLRPLIVDMHGIEGGFYTHSSRTFRKWADRSIETSTVTWLQVSITGDIPECGAEIFDMATKYVEIGEQGATTMKVRNLGCERIDNITYTVTVDGKSETFTDNLREQVPGAYTYVSEVPITLPTLDTPGSYEATVTLDKVNGADNCIAEHSCIGIVSVVGYMPKHLPLVEELSGTSCGYCPRGIVGMEYMKENYGDDFIGVVWHGFSTADPMYPQSGCPDWLFPSAPKVIFDRQSLSDPYLGTDPDNYTEFAFPESWQSAAEVFTPVEVSVDAKWVDAENPTQIEATATVDWKYLPDELDADYRIEYVLVGDDIYGEGSDWNQSNYYSKNSMGLTMMDEWVNAGSYVRDMHYNDVGLISSGLGGEEGSIDEISVAHPNVHSFVFDTSKIKNYRGEDIPFHNDKLKVVAFVLKADELYGKVLNAARCAVPDPTSGIESISADDEVVAVKYIDMQGREVAHPAAGNVYLKVSTKSNGHSSSMKVRF